MAERLAAAQQTDHCVLIPAVVLAEVATGAPTDAAIWHVLGRSPALTSPRAWLCVPERCASMPGRCGAKVTLTVEAYITVAATAVEVGPVGRDHGRQN